MCHQHLSEIGHVGCHRLLDNNQLSGEIPANVAALPVRGAILKYVLFHFTCLRLLISMRQLNSFYDSFMPVKCSRSVVCSVANNPGLCGVGVGPCSKMSLGENLGLYISLGIGLSCMAAGAIYVWKKKIAITRGAQRLRKH